MVRKDGWNMTIDMNQREEDTRLKRYSYCDNIREREDLIFLYPSGFAKNADVIADKLQVGMDFLKRIANLDPTTFFEQRVVIGYRHPNDEGGKNCQPGWLPNWVNIPWDYIGKSNEPLDICTHELVHPFFRCSPLHNCNEGWGDGFCDFLRGPLKKLLGLDGDNWWRCMIRAAQDKQDGEYHYPAGQFILKAYEKYRSLCRSVNDLIDDHDNISAFVKFLFLNFGNVSLSMYITPSPKMMKKWQYKNKI